MNMNVSTFPVESTSSSNFQESNPSTVTLVFAFMLMATTPFTILANIGAIIAFWKEPSLRYKSSDLLLLSLTCCDLGQSLLIMPVVALYGFGIPVYDETGCRFLWNLPADTLTCVGTLTLMAISRDRYLLVAKEYPVYLKIQTRKKMTCGILIIWLLSLSMGLLDVSVWDFAKSLSAEARSIDFSRVCLSPSKKADIFAIPIFLLVILFPELAVVAFSVLFLKSLRHRLRKRVGPADVTSHGEADASNAKVSKGPNDIVQLHTQRDIAATNKRYIKPAVTLGLLVAAMTVCIGPYCIFSIVAALFCPECDKPEMRQLLIMIMLFNSFLNPFLYTVTNSKLRRYFYKRMACCLSRQ